MHLLLEENEYAGVAKMSKENIQTIKKPLLLSTTSAKIMLREVLIMKNLLNSSKTKLKKVNTGLMNLTKGMFKKKHFDNKELIKQSSKYKFKGLY